MLFAPYHRFDGSTALKRVVAQLAEAGKAPAQVIEGHRRYHMALLHKLQCAKHHVDRLEQILTSTDAQEATSAVGDFVFQINMSVDGFFYSGGSALDILAREVLVCFGLQLPANVYFNTAEEEVKKVCPNDPILQKLAMPRWFGEFRNYRNALTHELILATNFQINVAYNGMDTTHQIVIPLPDDPRAGPDARSHRKNPDVLAYAKDHMRRLISTVNKVYLHLAERAKQKGSLPL